MAWQLQFRLPIFAHSKYFMAIHIHVHLHHNESPIFKELMDSIILNNQKIDKLMSNTDQALADLQAIGTQLTKIGGETATLLQKITDLENSTTSDTPQSVLDAIAAVKLQAQAVDDAVPDAAVTPTV